MGKYEINGVRYLFGAVYFCSLVSNVAIRVNLNVAIVAMVNSSAVYVTDNKTSSQDCSAENGAYSRETQDNTNKMEGEFLWSPKTQGIILGSFYYGYCTCQIVAGRLSEIYGGKWVYVIANLIASLLSILTPAAAYHGVAAIVIVRALQGMLQGVIFPSTFSMIGHWLPDNERGVFSAVLHSGYNVGIVIGMAATGYICTSEVFRGWPDAFYIFGSMNVLMLIIFSALVTNSPFDHPLMSEKEKKYISSNQEAEMNKYIPPIPWKKILTSVPAWALLLTCIGQEWCFFILLNELPTFLATVLHFSLEDNGLFSSLPFLLKAITGIVVGFITDALIRKQILTVNFVRKFCTAVASCGIASGLLGVSLAGCNATLCVIFLMCSMPTIGFGYSGSNITHLCLSSEYAGTLMGITNSISSVTGFFAPMFVGFMTNEHQSLREWHIVFGTAIALELLSCFIFVVFASTKRQKWTDDEEERTSLVETPKHFLSLDS